MIMARVELPGLARGRCQQCIRVFRFSKNPLSPVSTGAGSAQAGIHGSLANSSVCYRSDVWILASAGKTMGAVFALTPGPSPAGRGGLKGLGTGHLGLLIVQETVARILKPRGTRWGIHPPNPLSSGVCYAWQTWWMMRGVRPHPRPLSRGRGRMKIPCVGGAWVG